MNAAEFPYQQPLKLEITDWEINYPTGEDGTAMISGPNRERIIVQSNPHWMASEISKLVVGLLRGKK